MTRSAPPLSSISPGWIALHGNQSESLAQAVIAWLQAHPLDPLEEEIVLVQSNGVAEWFKMELARQAGVCAATRVELPGRFLWRTYRQVLGAQAVPRVSPLDKRPMAWRLMRLLPGLLADAGMQDAFAPVRGYWQDGHVDHGRALQLATRLADLLDQYQNYRADWLQAWAQGQDVLIDPLGIPQPVSPDQRWQPLLWRALLDDLAPEERAVLRPGLHGQVIERLRAGPEALAGRVARRVVVFGMSHLPGAMLDALEALAAHTQVVLAVPNPCRYHWGDIVEGRELLRHIQKRRHGPRPGGVDLSAIAMEDMHQHAHPLLAAWGRQARDFIRELDARDTAEPLGTPSPLVRIDLFDEGDSGPGTLLLTQLQRHIRDLVPQAEAQASAQPLAPDDRSLVFHLAHSPVRELEVLHDQLLDCLAERRPGQAPLQPRDIVVMVPDIEAMAPAIRAVFGQYPRGDARHIPFDIADLSAQASSPLVTALEWLLRLPAQRCRLSELVDLLAVPAVAARFGLAAEQLPRLGQWMQGAGIRWGLNSAQRKGLDLDTCGEQNSAWFGLQRMLLGYAAGTGAETGAEGQGGDGIAPYAEIGGLDAELAGALAHLLQTLIALWGQATEAVSPTTWAARGRAWLDALFLPQDALDRGVLAAMRAALATWLDACDRAGFDQPLALAAFRSAWLEALEPPLLERRFRAGGVTFCTLMPMRAIPFEAVCLLGMNDGDYPRRSPRSDFDLMGERGQYRPGDRARHHDDRQLMLEALLSARRLLYVSWTGRHVRDNSELPPSVLVAQLRDHLAAVWGAQAVQDRSTAHPLQPFSRRYFEGAAAQGRPLSTHAREWRAVHAPHRPDEHPLGVAAERLAFDVASAPPLTLARLESFLRNPVKVFFKERLGVAWPEADALVADTEAFVIAGLDRYQLLKEQLQPWPPAAEMAPMADASPLCAQVDARLARLRRAGSLPLQGFGLRVEDELRTTLHAMASAWQQAGQEFSRPAPRLLVELVTDGLVLRDALAPLWGHGETTAWLELVPSKLLHAENKKKVLSTDKLLAAWLRALAASAMGLALHQRLVGQDAVLRIDPLPPGAQFESQATLQRLLATWNGGQQAPLPLPLKTALAAAQAQENAKEEATPADLCDPDSDANATAQKAYEGGDYSIGFPEVQDPSLARVFPDFEALLAAGTPVGPGGDGAVPAFHGLAQALYRPMLAWAKTQVEFTPHSTEPHAAHEGEPA
ncbi:MAG: exodeoxyribonuclease V subunit gamma [Burkholderiaceae bacterium]|nr:exodeoxyribonuclease V subunit gamma [Burkholderiaceae bacterium]